MQQLRRVLQNYNIMTEIRRWFIGTLFIHFAVSSNINVQDNVFLVFAGMFLSQVHLKTFTVLSVFAENKGVIIPQTDRCVSFQIYPKLATTSGMQRAYVETVHCGVAVCSSPVYPASV